VILTFRISNPIGDRNSGITDRWS